MSMALCLGYSCRREKEDKKVQIKVKMKTTPFGKAFDREYMVKQMLQSGSVIYQVVHKVSICTKNSFDGLSHTFCSLVDSTAFTNYFCFQLN